MLAWQGEHGWQWPGAAEGQGHGHSLLLQPDTSPRSRARALACLPPLPAKSWCPKPFSARRLQCWSSPWLVRDCGRRGLCSGTIPWPHPEGPGLGSVGNQAGPTSQGQLHATRGCVGGPWVTAAEKELCQLLPGRAGPAGGSTRWLQPLPFPCTQGHHQPAPEPQHPVSLWSSPAPVLVAAGR